MNKLKMLKSFINSSCFPLLTEDELKLYILLLVNATDVEVSERIKLKEIEITNVSIELKSMMDSLERYGLAVMEGFQESRGRGGGKMKYRLKNPVAVRPRRRKPEAS